MTGEPNWRDRFHPSRTEGKAIGGELPTALPREEPNEDALALDLSIYKPWIIQRGRTRPAMLLDLRRYEAKSGLWIGWQMAYPQLIAAEYIGDRMLSLDFGTRQFMIEGRGLDELVRHLQQGTVLAIQEYAAQIWPTPSDMAVTRIVKLDAHGAHG